MWSEGITGRAGVTGSETYHRLGIYISVTDLMGSTTNERNVSQCISSGDLAHILIHVDSLDRVDKSALLEKISILGSLVGNPLKKLMCTLNISIHRESDDDDMREICSSGLVSAISLSYQRTREDTVAALKRLKRICSSSAPEIRMGLEGCPRDELQWIFEHSFNSLAIVNVGTHTAPNLCMRQADFAHSRLCNMYISFDTDSSDDARYDYIRRLSEKYNRPPALVLTKALMQLGFIVMFDSSCDLTFLKRDALSLCHPLTNRDIVLAPQKPKSFIVSDADLHFIIAASEVVESEDDVRQAAGGHPEKRDLAFPCVFGEM